MNVPIKMKLVMSTTCRYSYCGATYRHDFNKNFQKKTTKIDRLPIGWPPKKPT